MFLKCFTCPIVVIHCTVLQQNTVFSGFNNTGFRSHMFVKPESWLYIKYKCSPDSEFIAFVDQNDQTVVSNAVFLFFIHLITFIENKE